MSYGIFEFLVGFVTSAYVFYPDFNYSKLSVVHGVQLVGGLYVIVRGMDSIGKGLENTRVEQAGNRAFGG